MKNKGYNLVKKTIKQIRKYTAADDLLPHGIWIELVKSGLIREKFTTCRGYEEVKKSIRKRRKKNAADDELLAWEVWNALVKFGLIKQKYNIYHGYDIRHHFVD